MCLLRKCFRVLSYYAWQEPGLMALNIILYGLCFPLFLVFQSPYLFICIHPSPFSSLLVCFSLPPILAALGFPCLPEPGCVGHSHSEKPLQLPVLFGGGS